MYRSRKSRQLVFFILEEEQALENPDLNIEYNTYEMTSEDRGFNDIFLTKQSMIKVLYLQKLNMGLCFQVGKSTEPKASQK